MPVHEGSGGPADGPKEPRDARHYLGLQSKRHWQLRPISAKSTSAWPECWWHQQPFDGRARTCAWHSRALPKPGRKTPGRGRHGYQVGLDLEYRCSPGSPRRSAARTTESELPNRFHSSTAPKHGAIVARRLRALGARPLLDVTLTPDSVSLDWQAPSASVTDSSSFSDFADATPNDRATRRRDGRSS